MKTSLLVLAFCFLGSGLFAQNVRFNHADALMNAARDGKTLTVEKLISSRAFGFNVNTKDFFGNTALMWAAMFGHTETVIKLKEMGADLEARNNEGMTAFMMAADVGQVDILSTLKELGANVNAKDKEGRTAYRVAKMNGNAEVALKLVELGPDAKDVAMNDARAFLLLYVGKEKNTPDSEIAFRSISELYEGLLYKSGKEGYAKHFLC
jgi:ankyrin repeat protein